MTKAPSKPKRILLPVRHLREWIERNILLELAIAPFSKEDATLVTFLRSSGLLECIATQSISAAGEYPERPSPLVQRLA
jgi:hypothetical protein